MDNFTASSGKIEGQKEKANVLSLNYELKINFLIWPRGGAFNPESATTTSVIFYFYAGFFFYCFGNDSKAEIKENIMS